LDIRALVAYISEWLGAIAATWLLSLSPRFKQPVVGFKYARRDGITALSLYVLILLFAFVFYSLTPPVLPDPLRPAPGPISPTSQNLILALVSLAAFVIALVVRRQPIRSIGWNPVLLRPGLELGLALAILTIFLHNRVMDVLRGINSEGTTALLIALAISLAEETIFRGYIQMRMTWWLGQWNGLVLTALMFALWHTPAWLNRLPSLTILLLFGLTFVQGLVLGWVMQKSGNVAAPALYRAVSIWMQFIG
jgi:membrane protease YdiL (CAAX protease family)